MATMSETGATTPKKKLTSLTLVSMNIANCQPSAEAPKSWTQREVTHAIQQELLQNHPDILALQECPSLEWAALAFENQGYRVVGHRGAHAGYVALLVRNTLPEEYGVVVENVSTTEYRKLPAVVASLRIPLNNSNDGGDDSTTLMIASVHLAPFRGGNWDRRAQMESLLELAGPHPLIISGDTNMREEEDKVMEEELGFLDAWKQAGSHPSTKYTWDTRNHLLNTTATLTGDFYGILQDIVGGGVTSSTTAQQETRVEEEEEEERYFNRYYGANTREYATRYDRIYISLPNKNDNKQQEQATSSSTINNEKGNDAEVQVESFGLIANKPVTPSSRTHFLSDHFGIACKFKIDI